MQLNRAKRKDIAGYFEEIGKNNYISDPLKFVEKLNLDIAISLSTLTFLTYFRVKSDVVIASSEKNGRVLIAEPGHKSAIGVHLLLDHNYRTLSFFEINSPKIGCGGLMVDAVMSSLPEDWTAVVAMDYSNGFWEKMKFRHQNLEIM